MRSATFQECAVGLDQQAGICRRLKLLHIAFIMKTEPEAQLPSESVSAMDREFAAIEATFRQVLDMTAQEASRLGLKDTYSYCVH